jgi:lipopolysaccharide/colanic/teichoic acid biosynthesis glycosyltransferase
MLVSAPPALAPPALFPIRVAEGLTLYMPGGGPLVRFRPARAWLKRAVWTATTRSAARLKRAVDVCAAAVLLVALGPLLLLVALAVRLQDGGPALFWQVRVGRHGRPFWFPKFRSMRADAERLKAELLARNDHGDGVTFKMKRDPRVTWVGRVIRKLSVDELPQLWCVLRGEMSLVGPRPPVPQEVVRYTPAQRRRLDVVPGLTCLWQVSGRGDLPFPRQVELDIQYIESQSLWTDVRILLMTVPAVLFGRGAY